MSKGEREFDVDVEINATVRVRAESEEDALDVAEMYVQTGTLGMEIHSVYPTGRAQEVA